MTFDPVGVFDDVQRFLEAGGPVVKTLLIVAIVLWAMIVERFLFYRTELPKLLAEYRTRWSARSDHRSWNAHKLKQRFVAEANRKMRGSLPMIRACIAMCPLVGLLGTVTGMIQAFEAITSQGVGDPQVLSGGIGEALITTAAGLIVAIPALIGYRYLRGLVDFLVVEMEKEAMKLVQAMDRMGAQGTPRRREAAS